MDGGVAIVLTVLISLAIGPGLGFLLWRLTGGDPDLRLTSTPPAPSTESPLEDMFLSLISQSSLERPELQYTIRVGWFTGPTHYRADFAWPRLRLIGETDSAAYHRGREDYDRRRDQRLASRGWRTLRFSWDDVVHNPPYVTKRLTEAGVSRLDR